MREVLTRRGVRRDLLQWAIGDFIRDLAVLQPRPVTFDEVFVGVRGVKLYLFDSPAAARDIAREDTRDEGFTGSGRAVENDLPLVVKQPQRSREEGFG